MDIPRFSLPLLFRIHSIPFWLRGVAWYPVARESVVPLQTFLHLLHHLLVIYTIQYIQYNMCKCNTQYNICNTICANVFTIHYAIYANVSTIECESVDPLADPLCSGGKFWGSSKCVVFPSQMVVEMSKHGVGAMSGQMSSEVIVWNLDGLKSSAT